MTDPQATEPGGEAWHPDGPSRHDLIENSAAPSSEVPTDGLREVDARDCPDCHGDGWTPETTADPDEFGQPGEPYQYQHPCAHSALWRPFLAATPTAPNDDGLRAALLALWRSYRTSPSTRPPDDPGPGGMMMTGWVRAERVQDVLDAIENDPALRSLLAAPATTGQPETLDAKRLARALKALIVDFNWRSENIEVILGPIPYGPYPWTIGGNPDGNIAIALTTAYETADENLNPIDV